MSGAPYIRVSWSPVFEEAEFLELDFTASNGAETGRLSWCVFLASIRHWGEELQSFWLTPDHAVQWESRADRPEGRGGDYFRMRAVTLGAARGWELQFCFHHKEDPPGPPRAEFSLECNAAAIRRLGRLFVRFAELDYAVMEWTPTSEALFRSEDDPGLVRPRV